MQGAENPFENAVKCGKSWKQHMKRLALVVAMVVVFFLLSVVRVDGQIIGYSDSISGQMVQFYGSWGAVKDTNGKVIRLAC